MNFYEKLLSIDKIKEKLMDDESRVIFNARIAFMITKDEDSFIKTVWPFMRNMYCPDLTFAYDNNKKIDREIIIFGSGHDGIMTKHVLDLCGYSASYYCDSDSKKIGKVVEGLQIISKEELIEKYHECLVILASRIYKLEMYKELAEIGFPIKNVVFPRLEILCAFNERQYFDVLKSGRDEVFIDAGSYNGNTIEAFMSWTGGKYKKIYAFEPLEDQYKYIEHKSILNNWNNVILYKTAAWNKKEKLNFANLDTGSRVVGEDTGIIIEGCDIDSMVKGEKITYIKMDIEGSELKALEGARRTIQRWKPKLAISVYHKNEDIIELPLKILELVPEYKFYLRHYSTEQWETILYAYV